MARFNPGVLGPTSGKVGALVAASWRGQPYLRSLPRIKRRKQKPTGDLKQNRSKFSTLHFWLQPLIDFLRIGFKGYAPLVDGFNAAKSFGLRNAFTGKGDDQILDPSLVRVSHGDLLLPAFINFKQLETYVLEFSWDTTVTWHQSHSHDQVMLLAYDNVHKRARMKLTGQFRQTGKDILELSPMAGYSYHVYAAFIAHDRSQQSNSVYLGMIDT